MSSGYHQHLTHDSESIHYQQTTVPIHGFSTNSNSTTFFKPELSRLSMSSSSSSQTSHQEDLHLNGAGEALGDLITTISELYEEKVPAVSFRMKFDKLNDLVNLQKGEKVVSVTSLQGLHVSVEELSKKLERFKVRTVQVGEVVKQEVSKQASIEIDSPCSRWFIHSA